MSFLESVAGPFVRGALASMFHSGRAGSRLDANLHNLGSGLPVAVRVRLLRSSSTLVPDGRRWLSLGVGPGYLAVAEVRRLRPGVLIPLADLREITVCERGVPTFERLDTYEEEVRDRLVTIVDRFGEEVRLAASTSDGEVLQSALDLYGQAVLDLGNVPRGPLPWRGFSPVAAALAALATVLALGIAGFAWTHPEEADPQAPMIAVICLVVAVVLVALGVLAMGRNRLVPARTSHASGSHRS